MTRSERLRPVLKLKESHEREAGQRVGAQQQAVDALHAQLADLHAYRRDYEQKLAATNTDPRHIGIIRDYQQFLARLDQAIGQQAERVRLAQRELDRLRGLWLQSRTNSKVISETMARHAARESSQAERHAQRVSDEYAAMAAARRPGPLDDFDE
jgi:flagellar FliJ protein